MPLPLYLDPVTNFAIATVSIGYDASATSIALTAGHGALLPAPATDGAFNLTWWNATDYSNPSDDPNKEIVRVTARSTDTLTVTRAQESTSASTKNTSTKVYKMALSPTKKFRDDTETGLTAQKLYNTSLVAGETLSAGDSCVIVNDLEQLSRNGLISIDFAFGRSSDAQRRATSLTPRTTITSTEIKSWLAKVAAPTDNYFIEIQTDNAGIPSGTVITNGTSNANAGSSLNIYYQEQTFTFASAFTLTAGTKYWIVMKRSSTLSDTDYYLVDSFNSTTSNYASFVNKEDDGAGFVTGNGRGLNFKITPATGGGSMSVWKTDANVAGIAKWDGFANAAVASAGDAVTLITNGIYGGLSSLIAGSEYYPSTTPGALTTTVRGIPDSEYTSRIGRAISATQIRIDNQAIFRITAFSRATGFAAGATQVIPHHMGVVPKLIKIRMSQDFGNNNFGTSDGNGTPGSLNGGGDENALQLANDTGATSATQRTDIVYLADGAGSVKGVATLLSIDSQAIVLTWSTAVTTVEALGIMELYA